MGMLEYKKENEGQLIKTIITGKPHREIVAML